MNDPERDPWPSVDDPNDQPETCPRCEALETELHQPNCPLGAIATFDQLLDRANYCRAVGWDGAADYYMDQIRRRMHAA